jgi:transcription termination factor Rho
MRGAGGVDILLPPETLVRVPHHRPRSMVRPGFFRRPSNLVDDKQLNRVWILRQLLRPLNNIDSLEFLLSKRRGTKPNEEFLDSMSR